MVTQKNAQSANNFKKMIDDYHKKISYHSRKCLEKRGGDYLKCYDAVSDVYLKELNKICN